MKIAFSTLGCPDWDWTEIVSSAKDLSFDGIEIRTLDQETCAPKMKPFLPKNIKATIEKLNYLGLKISCLTSDCELYNKDDIKNQIELGYDYIDLAVKLNTPYIRVMGDKNPQPSDEIDVEFVAKNIALLADYAKGKSVAVLIETNGVFSNTSLLSDMLRPISCPEIGVLWDVHHPFRYALESIEQTYNNLRGNIRYVHIKDSVMENGKTIYKMMGDGDIPNTDAINLLKNDSSFNGYISLEWVKRWEKSLLEPGIVFPRFIQFMKRITK